MLDKIQNSNCHALLLCAEPENVMVQKHFKMQERLHTILIRSLEHRLQVSVFYVYTILRTYLIDLPERRGQVDPLAI